MRDVVETLLRPAVDVAGLCPPGPVAASRGWTDRGRVLGWAALLVPFGVEALAILRADRAWLIHRVPDDAFYYLEIGQRMARGQGATFDGVHHTNGFHPLWQVMVAGWATVFTGDALVRAALLTELACAIGAVLMLFGLLRRVWGTGIAPFALVAAFHSSLAIGSVTNGMESGLVVLALAAAVTALARFDQDRTAGWAAACGAACALMVLARVDLAAVVWLIPAVMLWRSRRFSFVAWWTAAAALALGPWVVWSELWVGHVLPVSGSIKLTNLSRDMQSRFGGRLTVGYLKWVGQLARHYVRAMEETVTSSPWSSHRILGPVGVHPLTLLALGTATALVVTWYRSREEGGPTPALSAPALALLTGLLLVASKSIVDLVTLPYWSEAWYSAPARLATGLLIGAGAAVLVGWAYRRQPHLGWALGVAVAIAVLPQTGADLRASRHDTLQAGLWQDANVEAVEWIRTNGPQARYGSTDAGLIGYYLDPTPAVVNLDGLVNSYSFAQRLLRGDAPLSIYRSQGVSLIVGRLAADPTGAAACGKLLWTSPDGVVYGGSADSPSVSIVPLRVYDIRSC